MRENLVQIGEIAGDGRRFIEYDWYWGGIPANVSLGEDVYLDTSYGFAAFHSAQETGLSIGDGSGTYDRTSFVVGKNGRVTVGAYTVLNGASLICHERINVGSHCLIAWGSVITDTWMSIDTLSLEKRREILRAASADRFRRMPSCGEPRPVTLEDNVWVGFDSVVLPGVTLGRGCIVGCKTVVGEDVPPYAVVVGNPPRLIRYLEADDTEEARRKAFQEYLRS